MIAHGRTLASVDLMAAAHLQRSLRTRKFRDRTHRLVSRGQRSALVDKQRQRETPNSSATSNLVVSLKRC